MSEDHEDTAGKVLSLSLIDNEEELLTIIKALSAKTRLRMLVLLRDRLINVNDVAVALKISPPSATEHIKILEKVGLIRTEVITGKHGLQKLCGRTYDSVNVYLNSRSTDPMGTFEVAMHVGHYFSIEASPTCGLASETGLIGLVDTPAAFYEPERVHAQLLWFREGYLTYRFPNYLPKGSQPTSLDLSAELCAEAPLHYVDWPSDITLWINDIEIGTWTCPSDFGGKRGRVTPNWWETRDSQYGVLKEWSVTENGSCLDGESISSVRIEDLRLTEKPFIEVRLGIKDDARHKGGLNIFGEKFGNYSQPILLNVSYRPVAASNPSI